MSFTVKKTQKNGVTQLVLSGQIDEEAKFPNVKDLKGKVVFDLDGVKAINSVGIRVWLQWFQSFKGCNFVFAKCPKALVMQMNMVEGFLPENSVVDSFYVPYYCESCDEEIDQLFTVGKEIVFVGERVQIDFDASRICSDGSGAELDANEAKYFKFLLKRRESDVA